MLRIELPWPPASLNPNRKSGKHWAATQQDKARYHAACAWAAVQARPLDWMPPGTDVGVLLIFEQPDRRKRDRDNLVASMKTGLDAVARELAVDDSAFDPLVVRRSYGPKPGRVIVQLYQGETGLQMRHLVEQIQELCAC